MKLEVFVSHLTVESKFADLLTASLTRDFIGLVNFFVSTDATSIPVGSQWYSNIIEALNRANLLLVICSRESVRRQWIQYEAGGAGVRGIEVIPLCHSGIAVEQLPVPLSMSEGALLTSAKGLKKLYTKISAMLGSAIPLADFEALAEAFRALEAEYSDQRNLDDAGTRERSDETIVKNPNVLCVSSEQYLKLGFDNQLQRVSTRFRRISATNASSPRLRSKKYCARDTWTSCISRRTSVHAPACCISALLNSRSGFRRRATWTSSVRRHSRCSSRMPGPAWS